MDAVKFMDERARMCNACNQCHGCPITVQRQAEPDFKKI